MLDLIKQFCEKFDSLKCAKTREVSDFFCLECGDILLSEKMIKLLLRNINPGNTGCVYSPKRIESIEYYRKRCFNCFEKKYNRKPKKLNAISYDLAFLFDIDISILKVCNRKRAQTLENCINRYGEVEGKKKWEEYCEKQAASNTFEYKKEKHNWDEKQFNEYNKGRAQTLENCINRYGEVEGKKKWEEYCEKQKYVGCSEEYFIEKYGKEYGLLKYEEVCKSKGKTLENFIKKYGDDEGKRRFEISIESSPIFYSKLSQELFWVLYNKIKNKYEKIYFGELNNEYGKLAPKPFNYFKYDFTCLDSKKIIEFNGDYWHANPIMYEEDDWIKYPIKEKKVKEVWEKDKVKIDIAKSHGFDILIIWEVEYRSDKNDTIQKCLNFLGENNGIY